MSGGYVGILSVELHIPESGSLKAKRKEIKSAKTHLVQRFHVAVAEVDHHDTWQRARLTVACVGRTHGDALSVLDNVERFLRSRAFEVTAAHREVGRADDWPG